MLKKKYWNWGLKKLQLSRDEWGIGNQQKHGEMKAYSLSTKKARTLSISLIWCSSPPALGEHPTQWIFNQWKDLCREERGIRLEGQSLAVRSQEETEFPSNNSSWGVRRDGTSNRGFSGGADRKESACNAGDLSSIAGSGRSPGEKYGNPFQHSCLGNPMDRGP